MKSVKKQLREEIKNTSFDESILQKIKSEAPNVVMTRNTSPAPKRGKLRIATFAASVCCVFALAMLMLIPQGEKGDSAGTYLTININPAIEFTLDANNNVSSQRALNETGAVVLMGNDFVNSSADKACEEIILITEKLNLLKQNDINIMVIANETANERQLCANLQNKLDDSIRPEITNDLFINDFDSDISADADEYGVSVSKMQLMRNACDVSDVPLNQAMNMPVSRLIELANDYRAEEMETFQNRLDTRFDEREESFGNNMDKLQQINQQIDGMDGNPQNKDKIKDELEQLVASEPLMGKIDGIDKLDEALSDGRDKFSEAIDKFIAAQEQWMQQIFDAIKLTILSALLS